MKIGRNEWFLGLFLIGLGLIVVSRFVADGPLPPAADEAHQARPDTAGPLEAEDPTEQAAEGEPRPPEQGGRRELEETPAPALLVRGLVVDHRGVPLEGARIVALERPPARPRTAARKMAGFLLDLQEQLQGEHGRGELDLNALMRKTAGRHVTREWRGGAGTPFTLSEADGRFSLGPVPWERCWLWAGKQGLALGEPVEARADQEVLLVLGPAGSVAVTVTDLDGKPVSQIPVDLLEAQAPQQLNLGPGSGASLVSTLVGLTDEEGRVCFAQVPLPGPYLAVARPAQGPLVAGSPVTVKAGQVEQVILRLLPVCSLIVRTVDESGDPLKGVNVSCHPLSSPPEAMALFAPPSGRTDVDGRVRFDGLPPGSCQVRALRLGREPALTDVTIEASAPSEIELVVPAGISVVGQVTGEGGLEIADALVGLVFTHIGMDLSALLDPVMLLDSASVTRTDRHGAFLLGGLPGRALTLMAWAPGYTPKLIGNIRPRPGRTVNFRLQSAGSVAGRVLRPDGHPVARFTAQLWQEALMGMRRLAISREFLCAKGAFVLQGVNPGEYTLRIEASGWPAKDVPGLGVESGEAVTLAFPVLLAPGASLAGVVLDSQSRPAPGVSVTARPMPARMLSIPGFSFPAPSAATDPEGRFAIEPLSEGSWLLEANAPGLGMARLQEPIDLGPGEARDGVRIVLERPSGLHGTAYDAKGDPDPYLRFLVQRTEEGAFKQLWTSTDAAGRFLLSDLEPGLWQIVAMGTEMLAGSTTMQFSLRRTGLLDLSDLMKEPRIVSVRLPPGETVEVTLGKPGTGGGTLLGSVRKGGRPLTGAVLTLRGTGADASPRIASSDQEGHFRVDRLGPGRYQVHVSSAPMGGMHLTREAVIEEGLESRLEIDFGGGVLMGRLVPMGAARQLGNHLVLLEEEREGRVVGSAITDAQGRFRLEGLGAGTYLARTEPWPGGGPAALVGASAPLVLGSDHAQADLELPVQPGASLLGTLEGASLETTKVLIEVDHWPRPFHATVRPDRGFTVHGLPPGRARISARSGERSALLELLLVSGEKHAVVLGL